MLVLRPDGTTSSAGHRPLVGSDSAGPKRIGLLENTKPNARALLGLIGERVVEKTASTIVVETNKGPGLGAASPVSEPVFEQLLRECDVVLTGSGDCGSCATWSVRDAIELERRGVPTAVVVTEVFESLARTVARGLGAEVRLLVIPHPLAGSDAEGLALRADHATVQVFEQLWQGQAVGAV